ncbi:MAG: hypothetical protein ACYDH9_03575 [Limisphaerales bacterium]
METMKPFRITCGIFAAASFEALLNLATVTPLSDSLHRASFCFSAVVIPLAIQSVFRWPDRNRAVILWSIYMYGFTASTVVFGAGILFLALHFGVGAAATAGFSLALVLLGSALQWRRRDEKEKNIPVA